MPERCSDCGRLLSRLSASSNDKHDSSSPSEASWGTNPSDASWDRTTNSTLQQQERARGQTTAEKETTLQHALRKCTTDRSTRRILARHAARGDRPLVLPPVSPVLGR